MLLSKFKIGVGPMSSEIINLILEYAHITETPIMIIASRNQVDHDLGYVSNTRNLVAKIKSSIYYDSSKILICRDHCGPYFRDDEKSRNITQATANCLATIENDIENGFDILHIDVGKVNKDPYKIADSLISRALHLNPEIILEFGSEDNTMENLDDLTHLNNNINYVKQFKNVKFLVNKTGSLTKHTQVGNFILNRNRSIADKIHAEGLLFKEHNADYLNKEQLLLRKLCGIDAINIAPELACAQTKCLLQFAPYFPASFFEFKNFVLKSELWKKWTDYDNKELQFVVSAHYFYNHKLGIDIRMTLNKIAEFKSLLRKEVFSILDKYSHYLLKDEYDSCK